jgi:hypothetical protein
MEKYSTGIEKQMRALFETLSEKDKRRYVAVETQKLGYGGQVYLAQLLGCSRRTIYRGLQEFDLDNKYDEIEEREPGRIRRRGGGRKPYDKKK